MTYRDIVKAQLHIDEGWKKFPYKDTVGKTTIGCGRNLDDVGLSDDEIDYLLDNDVNRAERAAITLVPSFDRLSDNRKAVLVNMALNMGQTRLSGFKHFLAAVDAQAWEQASTEMLDSLWAKQTGQRAVRLAKMMREG